MCFICYLLLIPGQCPLGFWVITYLQRVIMSYQWKADSLQTLLLIVYRLIVSDSGNYLLHFTITYLNWKIGRSVIQLNWTRQFRDRNAYIPPGKLSTLLSCPFSHILSFRQWTSHLEGKLSALSFLIAEITILPGSDSLDTTIFRLRYLPDTFACSGR